MDLIYGKCVQTGILGYIIGSGFHLWQHIDSRLFGSHPFASSSSSSSSTVPIASPMPSSSTSLSSKEIPTSSTKSSNPTKFTVSLSHPSTTPTTVPSTVSLTWRQILLESSSEGIRTSKILVSATAAAGIVSFLQHGRYSDQLYRLQGDALSTAAGVGAGVYMFIGPHTVHNVGSTSSTSTAAASSFNHRTKPWHTYTSRILNQRTGISFLAACFAGYLSGSMKRSSPFASQ